MLTAREEMGIKMPEPAQTEVREIGGREIKIHSKSPRFGEWLAWCYVEGASGLHHEGAGFEARAASREAARSALVQQVEGYLAAREPGA